MDAEGVLVSRTKTQEVTIASQAFAVGGKLWVDPRYTRPAPYTHATPLLASCVLVRIAAHAVGRGDPSPPPPLGPPQSHVVLATRGPPQGNASR